MEKTISKGNTERVPETELQSKSKSKKILFIVGTL